MASFGPNWQWDPASQTLSAAITPGDEAVLAVCTVAIPKQPAVSLLATGDAIANSETYAPTYGENCSAKA